MAFSLSATTAASTSNALAVDARSLNNLKFQAGQNSPEATKEAAKQFESLFMREMIKSMREATMKSGLLDSPQGDLGADLLDQQLSVQMSGRPGGLSEAISRQLAQQLMGGDVNLVSPSTLSLARPAARSAASATPAAPMGPAPKGRDDFVQYHSDAAERVALDSGIPSSFMLGQAGHETGWGKSEIKNADGSTSFNLFGIKAGQAAGPARWPKSPPPNTNNGVAHKVVAKFRAYNSYEDSFRDYARLINDNPRYEKAQASAKTGSATAYAAELQKAGYATDPAYAKKLGGAIQSALRAQQTQA
ncbi:MAG: flagellar assembly peptidoglycan hydrolase FlgJ [Giesbergeria sp.]